jgi:hypothetical protein
MEVLTEDDISDGFPPDAVLTARLLVVIEDLIGTLEEKEENAPYGINGFDPIEMAKVFGYEKGLREARDTVRQVFAVVLNYHHEVKQ